MKVIRVVASPFFGLNTTSRGALSYLACAREKNVASLANSLDFHIMSL